ncbi:hypothetical protein P7C73_g3115, partial [Tremellales sp. Uapishka_1]
MMGKSTLIGKPAPPLELPSIPNGDLYKLPIGEKPIALFFVCYPHLSCPSPFHSDYSAQFPQAGTTGCTKEACAFRDAQKSNTTFKRFEGDLEVVGISSDATAKQASFADEYNLPYPLISDKDGAARKAYDVGGFLFGMVPGRETFFIDRKGIVRGVCDSNIDFKAHTKFVEKQLKEMEKETPAQ